jgi:hypothetical protein
MVRGTLQALAIARRWSTAFVEPPRAMMSTMAFSKAARVWIGMRERQK